MLQGIIPYIGLMIMQRLIVATMLLILILPSKANADAFGDIMKIIQNLSCSTQHIGEFLTTQRMYSCVRETVFDAVIAQIISPGFYSGMRDKIRLNDDQLFDKNCSRKHRADYNDPMIDFGFCSNIMMIIYRTELIAKTVGSMVKLVFSGDPDSLWDNLKDLLSPDPAKFTAIHHARIGDSGFFFDIEIPIVDEVVGEANSELNSGGTDNITGLSFPFFPWKVVKDNDKICVATITIMGKWLSVGCKYISEPYPVSIYKAFTDGGNADLNKIPAGMQEFMNCSTVGSCAEKATNYSKAVVTISGRAMVCLREMLVRLLVNPAVCTYNSNGTGVPDRNESVFLDFQRNMHKAVIAFLTIYVIFVGFGILLSGAVPSTAETIVSVIKFVAVTYFAAGINIPDSSGGIERYDGMTEWIFPLLIGAITEATSWVMNASPSKLCVFNPALDYPIGLGHLALWDALDCKIAHYLGIDSIMDFLGGSTTMNPTLPPYLYLAVPALIQGNLMLLQVAIMYPLLVMGVGAFMVTTTATCMIGIVIVGVLGPIYVPMALFEYTKPYFEAWRSLLISFVLQPVAVAAFMTMMFAMYDRGFYGTCQYRNITLQIDSVQNDSFVTKKYFMIDNNPAVYADGEYETCIKSIGWILNNPFAAVMTGLLPDGADKLVVKTMDTADVDAFTSKYPVTTMITKVGGLFFGYVGLATNLSKNMVLDLLTCGVMLLLMQTLAGQLSGLVADISGGVNVSKGNGFNANAVSRLGQKGAEKLMNARKSLGKGKGGDKSGNQQGSEGEKDGAMQSNNGGQGSNRAKLMQGLKGLSQALQGKSAKDSQKDGAKASEGHNKSKGSSEKGKGAGSAGGAAGIAAKVVGKVAMAAVKVATKIAKKASKKANGETGRDSGAYEDADQKVKHENNVAHKKETKDEGQ